MLLLRNMKKKSKVGKKLVFSIALNPYRQECIVVVNGHIDDAVGFLKKMKTPNADIIIKEIKDNYKEYSRGNTKNGAVLWKSLPVGYIMQFDHLDSWVETNGLVVHESLHLVHYVLSRVGIDMNEDTQEAYTYLLESVTKEILAMIY